MCALNPHELKVISPTVIVEDRPCIKCGYNLIGLKIDGVCPECGRPIKVNRKNIPRYSDSLISAPRIWLANFAFASVLLTLSGIGMFVLLFMMVFFGGEILKIASLGVVAASIGWFLGV